jgi:ABC-type Na+ efflux pump permease subunit
MDFLCTMLVGLTMTCSSTYPALDALTGERERGTLVLLLMAPGDRKNIVAAKLLLVTLLTLLSAVISIASISVSILLAPPPPVDGVPIHLTVPLWNLLAASVFLPPIALSISACGLMVSSYAKTFQQGQSYFLPFVLLAMILTGLVLVVDQSAPFFINFVPIANLLLCLHKAIQGRWDALSIAATCVASSVFIGLLLHAAVGILDSEETLFGVKQPPGRRTSYI